MKSTLIALVVVMLLSASLAGCIGDDAKNKRPIADAGIDVEAEVGEEVVFSGTGLDNDGSVVEFKWDYEGDGEWDWSGEIGSRIHVYDRPGAFEAVLQVEDDEGARSTDTRWVNVTATVFINVNWTSGSAFVVHVSDRLAVGNMEVDWTMEGEGPVPITRTFTHDAGMDKLNDTAYTVDPSVELAEGQTHRVAVRLGDVTVASRTIEVVDVSDAQGAYDATYDNSLWDERVYGDNITELWRNGTLEVETRIGWTVGVFDGTGSWYTFNNRTGVITEQWVNLTEAAATMGLGADFGETSWRYSGHGDVNQTSETGFYIYAFVWDFLREMDNGTIVKDDWRRVGRYSGANDTNGSFVWNRTTEGNQVRQNGEGELYEVLKVRSEKHFDGTNLGLDFILNNLTFDYDASRIIFDNRTILRESLQEVGLDRGGGNWSWTNSSWTGFLDEGGDMVFNPDPLDYNPELGARFIGPRPKVLKVGDAFSATNFYGLTIPYMAKRRDTAPVQTPTGDINVTGVLAEAFFGSSWGDVHHWFWVLENGPLPGLVFEERVTVDRAVYSGGIYEWYRNLRSITPFS
jgi:hypothetical protein